MKFTEIIKLSKLHRSTTTSTTMQGAVAESVECRPRVMGDEEFGFQSSLTNDL